MIRMYDGNRNNSYYSDSEETVNVYFVSEGHITQIQMVRPIVGQVITERNMSLLFNDERD
jgi:hypothetical protein